MDKKSTAILFLMSFMGMVSPALAEHGKLSSTDRDGWINGSVEDLVVEGLVPAPSKPVQQLTNLEVAQLTARAGDVILAQAELPPPLPGGDINPPPALPLPGTQIAAPLPGVAPGLPGLLPSPAATKSVSQLVEEFRDELSAMGEDMPQLEDRIFALQHRNESLAEQQQELLKRTGTSGSGFSRGFFNLFRGFGPNPFYGSAMYNSAIFMDMDLRSVPVPMLLFDTTLRFWRTEGFEYADPHPEFDLRWLSLTSYNEISTLTAGDFFQHYTPLTLWNYEVPVYTLVEPASYYRTRKDVEDFVFADHGPEWRLRGFQLSSKVGWPDDPVLSILNLQAMAGPLKAATQYRFGDYFAGSQASMSFLNNNLELKGAGLLIWDDQGTAATPYDPADSLTWAHQYQVGSLSSRLNIPFDTGISLGGSFEYAGSEFQEDVNNPQRQFQDWSVLATGGLNIGGFHLTGKYLNIGPYFYSPGAQTNRYTPGNGSASYLSTDDNYADEWLVGYLNRYPIQSAGQPVFAPYDRMSENALPYGDATPDREGYIAGLDFKIGKDGWLNPQGRYMIQMQEIQPNYVLNGAGTGAVAVDSTTNTAVARTFSGWEAAVKADLAKAVDLKGKTYRLSFDYKNQVTNLGGGLNPFTVNTLIGAVDFNPPVGGFDSVVLSAAYEQAQASGNEYVLGGVGNPPTIANYPFYLDTASLGQYAYTPLNITRTSLAFGLLYPLSKTIDFRCDLFLNQYTWSDFPSYGRTDQIWRFSYEASY